MASGSENSVWTSFCWTTSRVFAIGGESFCFSVNRSCHCSALANDPSGKIVIGSAIATGFSIVEIEISSVTIWTASGNVIARGYASENAI